MFQGFCLSISLVAYTLIWRSQTQHKLMRSAQRQYSGGETFETMQRTFSVSFSLVFSFVIFYVVPNAVPHSDSVLVETFFIAVTYCGLVLDPILYLLLHSALRPIALELLSCKRGFTAGAGSLRGSRTTSTTIRKGTFSANSSSHHGMLLLSRKREIYRLASNTTVMMTMETRV